jgi:pimeloyl-ACP methyl ester carboxylesterase
MKHLVRLALVLGALFTQPASASLVQEHQGRWMGDMKLPNGATLKFGADLFIRADGTPWASVASPDQDAYDIPVRRISETPDGVELDFSFATLTMQWQGDHFKAVNRQGKAVMPLTMTKVERFPSRPRPQTPKGPFPYTEQTLAIHSAAGAVLGATLAIPAGRPARTVVVLVHGSGPQTRDVEMSGHRTFAVLSDYMARRGIAVLRYDKRGIAYSSGDYEQHTLPDLALDLGAVIKSLKARRQFSRIGVIAHSEGPEVAARLAAADPQAIGFIVSMAGVGLNGLDAMLAQDRVYAQDKGADPGEADSLMVYVRQFYETIIAHGEPAPREAALKALLAAQAPQMKAMIAKYEMNQGSLSLDWASKPFLRASLRSDTPAFWRQVHCPVLALNGTLDHQVPASANLTGLAAALKAGGNQKTEVVLMPSLNHAFQTAKTGREDEYAVIEETVAPAAMEKIAAFVRRQGR